MAIAHEDIQKMTTLVSQKKNSFNFTKSNTKFCLILYYNGNKSYLYVNKTEIYKFKDLDNKPVYLVLFWERIKRFYKG